MKKLQSAKNSYSQHVKAFICMNIFKLLYVLKLFFERIYHFCAINAETRSEHDKKIEEASKYIQKGQNLEKYEDELISHIHNLQDNNETLKYNNNLYKEIINELHVKFQNNELEEVQKIFEELYGE